MKFMLKAALFLIWLTWGAGWAMADSALPASAVPQVEEPDFSPPPVPEFMLRRPTKPLTLEEMQKQADEAARKSHKPVNPPPTKHIEPSEY